ncbi:N-acetylneuraminate synthase [Thalassotalea ganghwensis]
MENPNPRVVIIAEAGVNHNGDEALALKLVDEAKLAGADIVKFQTFKADSLVNKTAEQAQYQQQNTDSQQTQYQLLKQLELPFESHARIKQYCDDNHIEYLSTAFDLPSLDFLVHTLALKRLKIPSGELTNLPFILAHALTGCDLIVSTGMATIAEVQLALSTIAYGYLARLGIVELSCHPEQQDLINAFQHTSAKSILKGKVTLLHCTTEYPAPFDEVNLNVLHTFREQFDIPVGYSDHTQGIVIPIAAVAQHAVMIEKHFTLSRQMHGPDHQASIEPDELKAMIDNIRIVETAMGSGVKEPSPSELKNRAVARKSLVAKCAIEKGEQFSEDNLTIMRPGSGLGPEQYWQVLGKTAKRSFAEGDLIILD